jgi:hypothetical protein
MAAYLIVDIDSRDAAGMEEYRNRIPGTLAKYDEPSSWADRGLPCRVTTTGGTGG